jgi:hypothetical protein
MSQRSLILVILLVTALLFGVFTYFYDANKRFNWSESNWFQRSYSESSDQPYGTLMAHRLLESYFDDHRLTDINRSVAEQLVLDEGGKSNYFFVGEAMFMDSLALDRLLHFVQLGNTAFLSVKALPEALRDTLLSQDCLESSSDQLIYTLVANQAQLKVQEPAAKGNFEFAVRNVAESYDWHHFDPDLFCTQQNAQVLGYIEEQRPNFVAAPFGSGRFLLHTNPIVFSNYNMLRLEARPYISAVLSHLEQGPIYWDAASRAPSDDQPRTHPLAYILQQRSLAWAWYLLASLGLVWVIFGGKRRQRPIPILPKNENTSYEFIQTIADLHFRKKSYRGQCIQSMRLFLAQIRERYNLQAWVEPETNLVRMDASFYPRLARLSQVTEADIRKMFTQYENCIRYEPNENMMVELYLTLEEFLKKAK